MWVSFVKKNDPMWWVSTGVESEWRAMGEINAGLTRQSPQGKAFGLAAAEEDWLSKVPHYRGGGKGGG